MPSIAKANTEFTIFKFGASQIRVVNKDGDPWFVAEDLCTALNLSNATMSLKALDEDERAKFNLGRSKTSGGGGEVNIVSESGMYTLVLRCRDAVKAGSVPHAFRKWVTAEVLPSIRKTGFYHSHSSTDDRTGLRNAVNLLVSKKGLMYPEAYSVIHHRFNVEHLDQLTKDQLPQAVEYVHRLALEGEYLPAAAKPVVTATPQFTDEELNHLAWLWRVSSIMLNGIADIYPLLAVAEHRLASTFLTWKREYPYTLKRAQRHLIRETLHIPVVKGGDPVLLHLRDLREIN